MSNCVNIIEVGLSQSIRYADRKIMNDSRITNIENLAVEGSASEAKNICRACEFPLLEAGECASCSFRTELDFIERHQAGDCVSVILTGARVSPQLIGGKWYWTLDANFGDLTEFDGGSISINTTANSLEGLLTLPEETNAERLCNALRRFDNGEDIKRANASD